MRVDTVRSRGTPEGVNLSLRVAGPPVRLLAWGIDAVVMLVAQSMVALLVAGFGDVGFGFYMLSAFAISWFYPVGFEVLRRGATPGKSALGLQVVHDDGTPVRWAPRCSATCCGSPISCRWPMEPAWSRCS